MAIMKNDLVYFHSYEELSDYCHPFEKNLAHGISDEQRRILLESIAKYYRQRLDEISTALGCPRTQLFCVSRSARYLGRCWYESKIIELDITLICQHPLALTEVIIHELTHYKQTEHSKRFYDCMAKHVEKLELKQELNAYHTQQQKNSQKEDEKEQMIRKFFRIPTASSLYPSIPNGTLADFKSFQEFTEFCAPHYKNLSRVSGLLDRIKILTYAEHYFRKIIMDLATRLQMALDFSKIKIYITAKKLFIDNRKIILPVWFIGLEENVLLNQIVRLLTSHQNTDNSRLEVKVKENLSLLGIPEAHATSIFLFDFFGSSWLNCFNNNGRIINPKSTIRQSNQQLLLFNRPSKCISIND